MAYSTVEEMVTEALDNIDDPSIDDEGVIKLFNRCLLRVASKISLPDLDAVGLVSTTAAVQTVSTISFTNSSPATINDSGDGFVTAGHVAGSTITVNAEDDDDTVVNEGTFIIASVAAGVITLIAGDALTDEAAGTSITLSSYKNTTDLPDDFHRFVYKCYSLTQEEWMSVYKNRRLMDRRLSYQDETGEVVAVCQIGSKLYYQEIPLTPESLRVYYYKKPETIALDTESTDVEYPTYIPEGILDPLLIHYACYVKFAAIEDGMEGQKVNTNYHKKEYFEALSDLYNHYGVEQKEPEDMPQEFNFDAFT